MFSNLDYTMIIVSDMAQSVAFYRDRLGLPLKFESPDWSEFSTGTTTLALHGGGVKRDASGGGDQNKAAGTCSIGFNVSDVDKTYAELQGRGVRFVMPPMQREGEGIKLAVFTDPDGLSISIAQMAQ
ncbi:MAG TPA: VOC family protein [Terriglobia bacterium]|jgi:lactoylglutathione lyase